MQWQAKVISLAGSLRGGIPCIRGGGRGRRSGLGRYRRGEHSGGRVRDRAARVPGHIVLVWLCCGILGAEAAPTNPTNYTTAPTAAISNHTESVYNRNFFFLLFLCLVPLTAFMVGTLIKFAFPLDQDPDTAWYRCLRRRRTLVVPATAAGEQDEAAEKAQAEKKEQEERRLRGAVFLLFSVDKAAKEEEREVEKEWKKIQRELKRLREKRLSQTVRRSSRLAMIVPPDGQTQEECRQKLNSEGKDKNRAEAIAEASEPSSIKGERKFAGDEEKGNSTEDKLDSTSEGLNDDKSISSTQALLQKPERTEERVGEVDLVKDRKDKEPSADVSRVRTDADEITDKSNDTHSDKDQEGTRAKLTKEVVLNSAEISASESRATSSPSLKRKRRGRSANLENSCSNDVKDDKQQLENMNSPANGQQLEGSPAAATRRLDSKEDTDDACTVETSLNANKSRRSSDAKQPKRKTDTATASPCLDSKEPNFVVSHKKSVSAVVTADEFTVNGVSSGTNDARPVTKPTSQPRRVDRGCSDERGDRRGSIRPVDEATAGPSDRAMAVIKRTLLADQTIGAHGDPNTSFRSISPDLGQNDQPVSSPDDSLNKTQNSHQRLLGKGNFPSPSSESIVTIVL